MNEQQRKEVAGAPKAYQGIMTADCGGEPETRYRPANSVPKPLKKASKKREKLLRILSAPFGMRCWYCGSDLVGKDKHVDHIIPRCRGGTDDWDNLALTCAFCNYAKMDFTVDKFYEWMERVSMGRRLYQIDKPHPNANGCRSAIPLTYSLRPTE